MNEDVLTIKHLEEAFKVGKDAPVYSDRRMTIHPSIWDKAIKQGWYTEEQMAKMFIRTEYIKP
uniref:Uncharacterized protein n=1 Tax=viral metagenome TaxID=1070528 RepID=A0A6M3IY25_9ZZZZ